MALPKKVQRQLARLIGQDIRRSRVDYLAEKVQVQARIKACAENGIIAMVESGMDCDCSRYQDRVSMIPATLVEYDRFMQRMYDSAEGPVDAYIQKPSIARGLKSSSRDLALEAFENGHQHYVIA